MRVIFSLIFAGAGLFLFRLAALLWLRRSEWTRDGVVVEGEVVAIKECKPTGAKNRHPTFAPVVSYVASDGVKDRFTSSQSERPARYKVGDKVMVRYLGGDADIDGVALAVWPMLAVLLLAVLCTTVAVLPFVLKHT
jgi:hypothetical protein